MVSVGVTLFGYRVFADVIKLRCNHIGLKWALIQCLLSLKYEQKQRHTGREKEREIKDSCVKAEQKLD